MKSLVFVLMMVSSIAFAQTPTDPASPDSKKVQPMGAIKIENPEAATIQNPKADKAQKPTTKKPSAADVKAPTIVNPKITNTNENPQVSHPKDSKDLNLPKFDKSVVDQAQKETCEARGNQFKTGDPGFEQCKAANQRLKNK